MERCFWKGDNYMTDFLFAMPSFIDGMASVLDMGANRVEYNESSTGKTADAIAIYNDWKRVGKDLISAIEEINEKCSQDFNIILFFYTNRKDDPLGKWQECEDQGYVLTQLGRESNNTYVFSFDVNLYNPALNMLKYKYDIEKVPAIVINDTVIKGFKSLEELK